MKVQTEASPPQPQPESSNAAQTEAKEQKAYKGKGGKREGSGRPRVNPPPDPILGQTGESKKLYLPQLPGGWRAPFHVMVKWWRELTPDQLKYLAIYVYRKWPTWEPKRFDKEATSNIHIYAASPCPFTEESWEREILNEFGSGDYTFSINDNSVNRWTIWAKGLRDLENYPPLMDLRLIMLEDTVNKPLIQFLRLRGRLPEGMGQDNEGDSMAANAALERMAETTDRLTDKVIDLATEAARRPDSNNSPAAEVRGMELLHEGARESISFMRETMTEMTKNANTNPMEVVKEVVSLVGAMNGGSNKTDIMLEMMRSEREIAARREDAAREEARAERKRSDELMMMLMKRSERPERAEREDDGEPKGIMGMLNQLKTMKETLAELGIVKGDSAEVEPVGRAVKDSIIEMALRNAPVIMSGLESIAGKAMAMFAMSRGVPGAANPAPDISTLTAPPPPPAAVATNPLTPFLTAVTGSFMHHFNSGPEYGAVFADWLRNSGPIDTWPQPGMTGQGVYDLMKEQEASTPGAIKGVLALHPPIWSNVEKVPAKLDAFIAEFLKDSETEEEGE